MTGPDQAAGGFPDREDRSGGAARAGTANGSTRGDDARDRLVGAALESFAARGFHGTTTRDIASGAGMSPAALYVHHRSKEELLYRISRSGHQHVLRLVEDAVGEATHPVEQLRAVVRAFTEHHARAHTSARVVNYELAALAPEHLAEVAGIRRAIENVMRGVVERGVDAGVFTTANPRMTALALLSLGIDTARWYRDEGEWAPEEVAEHYCLLAVRMVGADSGNQPDPGRR